MTHAPFPAWHAHPTVWLVVGLLEGAYLVLVRRGRAAGHATTRAQVTLWSAGVAVVWAAGDWPVHDLAERYLYSVHMVQHTLLSLVAPPLLLLGTPAWLARQLLSPPRLLSIFRQLTRPLIALALFNGFIVFTHWPAVVTFSVRSEWGHFGLHALLMITATLMWWPVLSPLPDVKRLQPLTAMFYLFLQSVVPTVPASFLTLASRPLYHVYVHMPKLFGLDPLQDQLVAGLIMKLVGAGILWGFIAAVFFKWAYREERVNRHRVDDDVLTWEQVRHELESLPPATPSER